MSSPRFGLSLTTIAGDDHRREVTSNGLIAASVVFDFADQPTGAVPEIKQELLMACQRWIDSTNPLPRRIADAEREHAPRRPLSDVLV